MASRWAKKHPKYTPPKECHKSPVGPALFDVPDEIIFAHQVPTICMFVAKFTWEYPPFALEKYTLAAFMPRSQTSPPGYSGESAKNQQGLFEVQSGFSILNEKGNNSSWSASGGITIFLDPGVQQYAWSLISQQWNITKGKPLYFNVIEQTLGTDQCTLDSLIVYI